MSYRKSVSCRVELQAWQPQNFFVSTGYMEAIHSIDLLIMGSLPNTSKKAFAVSTWRRGFRCTIYARSEHSVSSSLTEDVKSRRRLGNHITPGRVSCHFEELTPTFLSSPVNAVFDTAFNLFSGQRSGGRQLGDILAPEDESGDASSARSSAASGGISIEPPSFLKRLFSVPKNIRRTTAVGDVVVPVIGARDGWGGIRQASALHILPPRPSGSCIAAKNRQEKTANASLQAHRIRRVSLVVPDTGGNKDGTCSLQQSDGPGSCLVSVRLEGGKALA